MGRLEPLQYHAGPLFSKAPKSSQVAQIEASTPLVAALEQLGQSPNVRCSRSAPWVTRGALVRWGSKHRGGSLFAHFRRCSIRPVLRTIRLAPLVLSLTLAGCSKGGSD